MIQDLKEIIAINSVLSEPKKDAPYGLGCKAALDWFLAKAASFGLEVGQIDGHAGWAEYGEGEKCVAALCHLDIVPCGEGWTSDPLTLTERDGFLYGRGVADDKGAAVMCLHALKQIKESAIKLKRRVRVIVGLNEENGSGCIKHYVKHCEIPEVSFVPDADFPVINSEKGILRVGVRIPLDNFLSRNVATISGGESINVIPDHAEVRLFADEQLAKRLKSMSSDLNKIFFLPEVVGGLLAAGAKPEDFSIKQAGEHLVISARGISGHAMAPDKADNALWKIFAFLGAVEQNSIVTNFMNEYVCNKNATKNLNIFKEDEPSGDTTMSVGVAEVDEDSLYFIMDIRLNFTNDHEDVKRKISSVLPPKSRLEDLRYSPNLFVDASSDLIGTLLGVYSDVTGLEPKCLKCGGGTYARELPQAVAFGPAFPGRVTNLHKPDECLAKTDFFMAAEVYKEAFIRLAGRKN